MSSKKSIVFLGLPKQTLARLAQYGYEDISDILATAPAILAKDLSMTAEETEKVIAQCRQSQAPTSTLPHTQKASTVLNAPCKIPTNFPALDKLLGGGMQRGHILEISGPPGSLKEKMALGLCSAFLESGDEVIVLDCQNSMSPPILYKSFQEFEDRVHYRPITSLQDFMLFMHQLTAFLDHHPKISFLLCNSLSTVLQASTFGASQRSAVLDRVKQTLLKATTRDLTMVFTSNLSTKIISPDGSPGTFDSGGRAVLVPALGHGYLPTGKVQRVVICPDGPKSGFISCPTKADFVSYSLGIEPRINLRRRDRSVAAISKSLTQIGSHSSVRLFNTGDIHGRCRSVILTATAQSTGCIKSP